jgi:RimJ/RimL family protein N-acetyltransferase
MRAELILRILDPERDGEALHAIFADEESCRFMSDPPTANVAETTRKLREWSRGCAETCWALLDRDGGEALGRIAMIPRGRDIWEAACMIVPAARGRGLAPKALSLAIDHAFEKRGARRVFADVDPENGASIRVFEKLGFQREGIARANWKTHIGVRDSLILSLIESDPRPWRFK